MHLRTAEPFWLLKNGLLHSYPSLGNDVSTEIVVIGGGITGALVSHALMENGYKVVLVDKRDIATGSTAATTSMLQYEIDVQLHKLAEKIGERAAAYCYQAGIDAIKKMEGIVKQHNIDCGFRSLQSLYIAHSEGAVEELQKEYQIRDKYKLGVQWLTAEEVMDDYGVVCFGAILSDVAGSIDAYKMAHELIQLNAKRGMQVYDHTEVTKFELDSEQPHLVTSEGHTIYCQKAVFCTGYETAAMLKEDVGHLLYTYACVSEQGIAIPNKLKDVLVWDTRLIYTYLRTTDDGRLLVGGEDAIINFPFFQQKIKEMKGAALLKRVNEILPDVSFVTDFNWGGTFGITKDGLPYIGISPEYENALFVLGFGGNGISFSIQAMDIIPQLLKGEISELAGYYRFGR